MEIVNVKEVPGQANKYLFDIADGARAFWCYVKLYSGVSPTIDVFLKGDTSCDTLQHPHLVQPVQDLCLGYIKDKGLPFKMYAGYEADGSYVSITSLSWDENTALKTANGSPLAEHCDIFDQRYMKQIVDIVNRPWNLDAVKEMWVSSMPGAQEVAVSLIVDGKRPANYPLLGEDARKVFDLVNSWPKLDLDNIYKVPLSEQIHSASTRAAEAQSSDKTPVKEIPLER